MKRTILPFIFSLALTAALQSPAQTEVYSNGKNSRIVFNRSNGLTSFSVEMRGKIEVTDDDKDIKSISPDGYLEISKVTFGSRRSIVITPEGSGVKREYYEGRDKTAFEPEGRKWLSEVLPELVRSTTIASASRVNRYFRQGGTNAVLGEIDRIESDYIKAHYADLLMGLSLPVKDYPNIVNQIATTIDSDHYLSQFLEKNMDKFLQDKSATDAVFAACRKIESDHYKTQVIKEALENQTPSADAIKSILGAVESMESDHYITEALTALLKKDNLSDATVGELINTTLKMESDHYKTVVLKKALSKPNLSATSFQRVVGSVKEIDSDHYKTEVLTDLMENKLSNEVAASIVLISENIGSDHYKSVVLIDLVKRQDLNDATYLQLIAEGSNSGSDHYASQFLMAALQTPNLSKVRIAAVINAAGNLDSDHYMTEVLTKAAPLVRTGDPSLKETYRLVAKKIDSETYYGRALRAIE